MLAPTGTVTLVFTDLRAERLWAERPDVVRSALRLHDKVLREAMRLHGGYEVKSENGAFMLAFGTAHDALEFVADAQRRLLCADWSQELLADRAASVVRGDANRLIFAGLREHGRPLRRRRVSHRPQHRAHGLFWSHRQPRSTPRRRRLMRGRSS